MSRPHDCDWPEALGKDAGAPAGFEGRVFSALAHLRDAWCSADEHNRPAVTEAIRLLWGQCEHQMLARKVLLWTLDPGVAWKLASACAPGPDYLEGLTPACAYCGAPSRQGSKACSDEHELLLGAMWARNEEASAAIAEARRKRNTK